MELLKVLNENGQETGEIVDKEIVHRKGLWHNEVAVWIFNRKGEILIQRRASTKKMHPNKLALCAGHVPSTEDSLTAMIREISEELGILVSPTSLNFLITEKEKKSFPNGLINRIFNDVYYLIINKKISDFTIQEEELSEIFWVDYLEFKEKRLGYNLDPDVVVCNTPTDLKTFKLLDQIYSKITH